MNNLAQTYFDLNIFPAKIVVKQMFFLDRLTIWIDDGNYSLDVCRGIELEHAAYQKDTDTSYYRLSLKNIFYGYSKKYLEIIA